MNALRELDAEAKALESELLGCREHGGRSVYAHARPAVRRCFWRGRGGADQRLRVGVAAACRAAQNNVFGLL